MLTFPAMPIHWYQIIPLHDGAQGCEQLVQNHYYAAAHQLELQSLDRKSNAQSAAPPHQPYRQISSVFNSKLTFSVGTFNLSAVTLADTARSL